MAMIATSKILSWWNSRETRKEEPEHEAEIGSKRHFTRSTGAESAAKKLKTEERAAILKEIVADLREEKDRRKRIEAMLEKVILSSSNKKIVKTEGKRSPRVSTRRSRHTPITPPKKAVAAGGPRKWSEVEYDIVALGLALYGRSGHAICKHLYDRNRSQTNGFICRNWDTLEEEAEKFPPTEDETKKLLAGLQRLSRKDEREKKEADRDSDDDAAEESSDEEGDEDAEGDVEGEDANGEGIKYSRSVGKAVHHGTWSKQEIERLKLGISVHGNSAYNALSAFVKTRDPTQTRMFVYRHFKNDD